MVKRAFQTVAEKLRPSRKPKVHTTLAAKVIRKDGTVEELGVISETKSEGWGVKADG